MARRNSRGGLLVRLAASVLPVIAAGALGSLATLPNIPVWYATLAKPPLTPPNAVFGPTWTLLYSLMALAMWRILSRDATVERRAATAWFRLQLALNALWSWAFFGMHSPAAGLVVIVALIAAIGIVIARLRRFDRLAAWLLAPYFVWVVFAAYLNAGVWWLNG